MKVRASTLCVRRAIKALKSQKRKRQRCIEVYHILTRVVTSMEVIATTCDYFRHARETCGLGQNTLVDQKHTISPILCRA